MKSGSMPKQKFEWHRMLSPAIEADPAIEVTYTDTLKSPGEGWYLVSKFGVGRVHGAGGSPARAS